MNSKAYQREVKKIVKNLEKKYFPEKIYLFGSFAWGKPERGSDIDLLIIKKTKKKRHQRIIEAEKSLESCKLPTDILVLTPKELEERKKLGDFFIKLILKKGNLLYAKK